MAASAVNLTEVLVERAHLDPRDAAAVADAIRECLITGEVVTKPYLEAQLSKLKSELLQQMYFALLGQSGVLTAMMYFFTSHSK